VVSGWRGSGEKARAGFGTARQRVKSTGAISRRRGSGGTSTRVISARRGGGRTSTRVISGRRGSGRKARRWFRIGAAAGEKARDGFGTARQRAKEHAFPGRRIVVTSPFAPEVLVPMTGPRRGQRGKRRMLAHHEHHPLWPVSGRGLDHLGMGGFKPSTNQTLKDRRDCLFTVMTRTGSRPGPYHSPSTGGRAPGSMGASPPSSVVTRP
jgi:hypothetical protein